MSSATNQSTQYNTIADAYTSFYPTDGESQLPCAAIEMCQLHSNLTKPQVDIRGKRVLDLACGSGFYSFLYLTWGAESVTGVDISQTMVNAAKASAVQKGIPASTLNFAVGDVTDARLKLEGKFDIVTSAWLLNYAPDTPTMTKMWDTVARHLKPGGFFVGLTIPPLLSVSQGKDAVKQEAAMLDVQLSPDGAWGKYGTRGRVLGLVDEGLKVEIELGLKELGQEVAVFENYYLGKETFQDSIKACTVDGKEAFNGLEWQQFVVPEEAKKGKPVGYWNEMAISPLCRVGIARRL